MFLSFFILRFIVGIFVDRGVILSVGTFSLKYGTFLSLILFIISLVCVLKGYFKKDVLKFGMFFVLVICLGLGLTMLTNTNTLVVSELSDWEDYLRGADVMVPIKISLHNLSFVFTVLRYVLILSIFAYCYSDDFNRRMLRAFKISASIVLAYGLLEFVFLNLFKASINEPILNLVLGPNSYTGSLIRGETTAIKVFRSEPSYLSFALFIVLLICFIDYEKTKSKHSIINVLLSLMLSVLSMSFSSVLYLGLFLLFVFFHLWRKKSKKVFVFLFIALVGVILALSINKISLYISVRYQNLLKTLGNILNIGDAGKYNWSSEAVRMTSIISSFKLFMKNFLFGVGIGMTDCHSSIVSALVNIGILGVLCYVILLRKTCQKADPLLVLVFVLSMLVIGSFGFVFELAIPVLIVESNGLFKKAKCYKKVIIRRTPILENTQHE